MNARHALCLAACAGLSNGWCAPAANASTRCPPWMNECGKAPILVPSASPSNVDAAYSQHSQVVAPIDSTPLGQTYGRWAAQWNQWAIGVPSSKNPVLDTTGAHCGERQIGDVWFLAGSFAAGSFSRQCTVPAGKALFFPLIDTAYFAFLNDPPEQRTEAFVRSQATCTKAATIAAWIDGKAIDRPNRYFTGRSGNPSPFFNVQLPAENILGLDESALPELLLSPSAEQGYYLFIWPLRPGLHTIRWLASGCTDGNVLQDITYRLTVAKP